MANISGVTVSASLASIPSNSAITLVNLGTSTTPGLVTSDKLSFGTGNTVTFGAATGSTKASGIYLGSVSNVAATPYGDTSNY